MNAGQHTIRYSKNGDYGMLTPKVIPVEYQSDTTIFPGTCKKCVFGTDEHSLECKLKNAIQLRLTLI